MKLIARIFALAVTFLTVSLIPAAYSQVTIGELDNLADLAQTVSTEGVNVFACDPYLWAFIQGNLFTIMFVLGLLKLFAKVTPWSEDDKIVESLIGFFGQFKVGRKKAE